MPRLTLDVLRRDLEEYGAALAVEDYENAAGLRDDVDSRDVHEAFPHVHTLDALDVVKRALAREQDPREMARLRRLEMDVLGSIVEARFADEEDALVTATTRATVTANGVTVRWREVGERIRDEDDRAKRRAWKRADDAVTRRFLPREEKLERDARAFIASLGYPDDATRWEYAHGVDLPALDAVLQDVLPRTEARYVRLLADRIDREEGFHPGALVTEDVHGTRVTRFEDLEGHDVAHAMRVKRFDAAFPRDALVPTWEAFLQGMGFDPGALRNVTLDLADRPAKTDRAFVLGVRVPDDVRLVTKPTGGLDDWRTLFHEAAHVLHYALTDPALPYEDRYLGNGATAEAYAFLFEHLFENPRFLADVAPGLEGEALDDYFAWCALDKLMGVRDYAAALHYDLWAATAPLEVQAPRYEAVMTDALKWRANPLHYLDTDGFDGTDYLRAWMLEARHRAFLEDAFGRDWWRHPDIPGHLRALWRHGDALGADEVAARLGAGPLTMEPVLADVDRLLAGA